MKTTLILILTSFFSLLSIAQESPVITQYVIGYKTGDTLYSFYVFEEDAELLLRELYVVNEKKPSEKPIHTFRSQQIDGLEKVTIEVMEGTYFEKESDPKSGSCCKTSGIRTYRNKKIKNNRPESLPANVRYVKQVYFRDNNLINLGYDADVLNSKEKKDIALKYLESLIAAR